AERKQSAGCWTRQWLQRTRRVGGRPNIENTGRPERRRGRHDDEKPDQVADDRPDVRVQPLRGVVARTNAFLDDGALLEQLLVRGNRRADQGYDEQHVLAVE